MDRLGNELEMESEKEGGDDGVGCIGFEMIVGYLGEDILELGGF